MILSKFLKIALLGVFLILGVGCRQDLAEREVNKRINNNRKAALNCLSTEGVSRQDVVDFFNYQPRIPYWKNLKEAQKKVPKMQQAANNFSRNDKVRHCFVGYKVQKQWNHGVSLFLAFYKEVSDVGDCRPRTHFEIEDQVATILGSRMAANGKSIQQCHNIESRLELATERFLQKRDEYLEKYKDILDK